MRKRSTIIILAVRLILALTCVGALAVGAYYTLTGTDVGIGSYLSIVLVAAAGLGITFIPDFLARKDVLSLPAVVQTGFTVFLFLATFCGEILHFYERFAWWDTMLHLSSGLLFSVTGYMVFLSLNRDPETRSRLHPMTAMLFALFCALACGALWEIYEFAGDTLFGLNMQRWQNDMSPERWAALQNMSNLSCPGLMDTMKDVINDTIGALVSIPVLLPMIKRDNRYVRAEITAEELVESEWRPGVATLAAKS